MVDKLYTKIKKMRLGNGFSQGFVAGELGVSRPTFALIEKGERELTISEAKKLAKIFGLPLKDFLAGKEPIQVKVVLKKSNSPAKASKQDIRISVPQKNVEKFKEVLLYILEKIGAKPNIGETAIYKLLYFIDFDFYEKYETQLMGATYIKNHFGPTPVEFKKIVEDMEKNGKITTIKSKYFQYHQKKYLPRQEPDLNKLSATEIKHIDEVLARLSEKNAQELTDYSHNDVPWITAEQGKPLEYEAVFYRAKKTSVRNYETD